MLFVIILVILTTFCSSLYKMQGHCEFQWPWTTLVAFKDAKTKQSWHRSVAETDVKIRKRLLATKSGRPVLRNYDGATHYNYQIPPKPFEISHCRQEETPEECAILKSTEEFVGVDEDDNTIVYSPVMERRLNHKVKADKLV